MGILEDFGFSDDNDNTSYSQDEGAGTAPPLTDVSAMRRTDTSLPEAIIATAKQIGINPLDLATAISYETGGTFDKWAPGPKTQWGQHRGLIQWGEPQAREYGVGPNTSISDQLNAVGKYLVDRGVKAGMGLLDIYSAINAGRVGLYDRSDANNGGAPGTVRDKVNNQMSGHRIKAAQLLGYRDFSAPQVGSEPAPAPYARPDDFVAGDQGRFVPPEKRGPFPLTQRGVATIGAPTTTDLTPVSVPAMPGIPSAEAPPIPEQLAKLLISNVPSEPETVPLMDESAGLNLAKTASNISIPSQSPNFLLAQSDDVPSAVPTPKVDALPLPAIGANGAPQVPISGAPAGQGAVPAAPQPASFTDMLNTAVGDAGSVLDDTQKGARQFGAKAVGAINAMPTQLAAAVATPPALVADYFGYDQGLQGVTSAMKYAERGKEAANTLFGVDDKPATPFQKVAAFAGRNVTPMGKSTALATGLMMAADAGGQIITAANAKPVVTKEEAEHLLFPGIGNNANLPGPRVSHTVMTSAGPAKLDPANYTLLGVIGAATIGAVVAPSIAGRMIALRQGTRLGRPILNAPADVEAFSNRMDLLRTYDDKNAGLMRISRDMGTNPIVLDQMHTNFDFQSGSATRNLTNAAVITGDMQSPNFTFKVKTPVLKLAQAENEDVTKYMHLWNTYDQIREQERILLTKPQAVIQQALAAGPTTVRGMNKTQVRQEIAAMEASPEGQFYKDFRTGYRDNLNTLRRFQAQGEYATLSQSELKQAQTRQPNQIFQKDLDLENTDAGMAKASQTIADAMQEQIRFRMENEAKGFYIDNMVAQEPNFARQVTAEELKRNQKSWGPNVVTFYRRGEKEYWVTDPYVADVLKMDPYMMSGVWGSVVNGSRKVVEKTTTGVLAPWFSMTNMIRNYHLSKVSPEPGMIPPTIPGVVSAVPQALYPQMAKHFSQKLDDWSSGWLGQTLGQQNLRGLSTKLAQVYDQSLYAQLLKRGGVHSSMFLDYNREASTKIGAALQSAPAGAARDFLDGMKAFFDAIHNSANFAYAAKNIKNGRSINDVTLSAKQLTGDPQKIGQFANRSGKAIRFDDTNSNFFGKAATKATQGVGLLTEVGRNFSPWWNVTTQGMKRVGKAYLDNPAKFVGRAYLYQMMPAAALYMYNRGLGNDPHGISYSDYQMNRRSGYNSLMTMYIGLPGRPAEDGILVPLPHELAAMHSMMTAAMHHLTHSDLFSRADDYIRAALAMVGKDYKPSVSVPLRSASADFLNIAKKVGQIGLIPATPAFIGATLGSVGVVAPNGPFGGAYQRHSDPYDDAQGLNTTFELVARAIAPGLADIMGTGYAAYTHSPDAFSGIGAGMKASGKRAIEKTPIARDVFGWKPPVAGSTDVTEELFDDKKILSKLDEYYTRFDPTIDRSGRRESGSKEGRLVADFFMPDAPPKDSFGLPPKPPANALYGAFMQELDRRFRKDTISDRGKGQIPTGGIGFPSQMARYSAFTRQIKDMRKIDDGNLVTWQQRINSNPELKDYLVQNRVPVDDPRSVRNFLEQQRQSSARQIMFTLKAVEQDFQKRLNDPNFSFEKLDPNQPYLLPPGIQIPEFVPKWPDYADDLGIIKH